jgi:sugar phosphate isomerase/epimerase
MNVAVMAYSYAEALKTGETDLAGVIRSLREMKIGNIELMHSLLRAEDMPAVRSALAQVPRVDVTCYDVRIEDIVPGLTLAASFGAELVMVTPDLDANLVPSEARRQFAGALRRALPLARELGLILTIENLGILADTYGRSEQIEEICEAVGPELRVTFDAGNFLLAGEDAASALGRLAPLIAHVHFKDWKVMEPEAPSALQGIDGRTFQGAALGQGIVNLRGALERLHRVGYDGTISVEYEGPHAAHQSVRSGVEYLRELLALSERERAVC